jgi:hypothetical protein
MVACFGDVVKSSPIEGGKGFGELFMNRFAEWEDARDSDTDEISMVRLDLVEFNWVDGKIQPHESLYIFDGKVFYSGLYILPIYGYGAMEGVVVPPANEIVAFAESNIDSNAINPLLSQLHWQVGDRVRQGDQIYQLEDIQLKLGCISVFERTGELQPMVQSLVANELRRSFRAGDRVVVLAGLHKERTGFVLREQYGILFILITDDGSEVSNLAGCTLLYSHLSSL